MMKMLYFGALVDRLGTASEQIELPPDVATVQQLLALLRARGGVWEDALSAGAVRVTVNKQFAEMSATVGHGDEVAIISARL